jgi:hypothetical protein
MKYFIISNKAVFSALSHLFFQRSKVLMWTVGAAFCFLLQSPVRAQSPDKEVKKIFAPKGTHRAPFKKANEVALISVNLQFKLATRQEKEKRGVGNVITWGFLEGIEDTLMQEITDEYYKRLESKLKENGFSLSEAYKNNKSYQKLVDNNADRERETEKKNWGVAKIFTAYNAPYIEYPTGMMGAHSSLGNDLKMPVGQLLITIDFIDINQTIKRGSTDLWGYRTDKLETEIQPVIRIEGISSESFDKQFKGDGTYAKFTGGNWSYCNAMLQRDYAITSDIPYVAELDKVKGMPEKMKKIKSTFAGDMASMFSGGVVKSGRGAAENTFMIYADPMAYKAAVLNALDKYNDYLLLYIKTNN